MRIAGFLFLFAWSAAPFFALLSTSRSQAEEPARAFLQGLQTRGLHDMALAYLDQLADSPLAPAEFKSDLLYEKSLILLTSSRNQSDAEERQRQLDQARSTLRQFIEANSSHPRRNAAQIQLGMLTVEQARIAARLAEADQSVSRLQEAKSLCQQAITLLDEQNKHMAAQLAEIPKVLDRSNRDEAKLIERRKQLRADVLQTEQLAAATREELAGLLPAGSEDQKKLYQEAAARYDQIYKDYRTLVAGRTARLYQARCYLQLGRVREALAYLGELLELPNDSDPIIALKAKALAMAMSTWLLPEEGKYLEVVRRGTRWFQESPASKHREADWVAIRYQLARGLKIQAEAADSNDAATARTRQLALQTARDHLRFVAGETGPYQSAARDLLEELGVAQAADKEPDTFAAAQAAGRKSLDLTTQLQGQLANLQAQAANDPSTTEQLSSLQNQLEQAQADTVHYLRLALELADQTTTASQVGIVQYFLCYAYYLQQDYYRAAVLGEFVARHHTSSPGSGQCGKIAVASYLQSLEQSPAQADALLDRLTALGRYSCATWPGQAATTESLVSLLPAILNARRFADAAEFVDRLPEGHPALGELQLLTGQGLWGEYREREYQLAQASLDGSEASVSPISDQETANIDRARTLLLAGYQWLPKDNIPSESQAIALLALAQIHLHDGNSAAALSILEAADIGLLTLAESTSGPPLSSLLIEEIHRTALRAYVASFAQTGPEQIAKAQQTMDKMRKAVAQNPAGQQRMLGVFVNMAHDVSQQLQAAAPDQQPHLIELYEQFLLALAQTADDGNAVHWVATTFVNLANDLAEAGENSAVVNRFYHHAEQAFQKILNQSGTSRSTTTQVKVQLADTLTKQDRFSEAIELYRELLASDPNAINLQVAAAELLSLWGQSEPQRWEQAVAGDGQENGGIWGWAKIASTAIRHEPFRSVFYQARYEIARSRFAQAQKAAGSERSQKLADAQRNLTSTITLYPELGDWKQRYDDLLSEIKAAQ